MTVNRTQLKHNAFDRKRVRAGLHDDLVLVRHVAATGYTDAETIDSGWYGERILSHRLGAEFFEVRIAENDTDLTPVFLNERPSHLKMKRVGATLWMYYKVEQVEEPLGTEKVWVIECSPTGTRKAA
jgi:hypothetical protein